MTNYVAGEVRHDIALWFADHTNPDGCLRAFEAYGHAMATASGFEQYMAVLVMKAYALGIDKRAGKPFHKAEGPALVQQLLWSTYAKIMSRLLNCYTLSDQLVSDLKDGKGFRDNLAHNFWQAHMGNLFSPEGVDVIATTCMQTAHHFRLLAIALTEETGVSADDYIAMIRDAPDRAEKVEGWNDLLREHELM